MNTTQSMKTLSIMAMMLFMFVVSCKDTETISFSSDDNSNLQSEANADAQLEDISDMASVAVSSDDGTLNGGKASDIGSARPVDVDDERFTCATVTLVFEGDNQPGNPHGVITIDFGDGCTGPNGRVRKGRILIEFLGKRFFPGSMVTISTDGYTVDGVAIDGTRTEVNATDSEESSPKFNISENVTVTFLDGTTATRISERTRTWIRQNNPLNDSWTVTGTASGKTRRDKNYVMIITKALVFKRACALESKVVIPVEGTKTLTVDNKLITTDFGDGTCDTKVTITINGRSKEVTVSANGD